jgi:hypothetical protein
MKGNPRKWKHESLHYVVDEVTGMSPEVVAYGRTFFMIRHGHQTFTLLSLKELEMLHYLLGWAISEAPKEP